MKVTKIDLIEIEFLLDGEFKKIEATFDTDKTELIKDIYKQLDDLISNWIITTAISYCKKESIKKQIDHYNDSDIFKYKLDINHKYVELEFPKTTSIKQVMDYLSNQINPLILELKDEIKRFINNQEFTRIDVEHDYITEDDRIQLRTHRAMKRYEKLLYDESKHISTDCIKSEATFIDEDLYKEMEDVFGMFSSI